MRYSTNSMFLALKAFTRPLFVAFRNVPEEEREAKYNRLISSTLFAMGYLIEMLPKDDLEILADLYHDIFKEKKFWKFGRHSSNMVSFKI